MNDTQLLHILIWSIIVRLAMVLWRYHILTQLLTLATTLLMTIHPSLHRFYILGGTKSSCGLGWRSCDASSYPCTFASHTRNSPTCISALLQFSSSILIYSLFLSFPITTIGQAIPCLTIAFSFSPVIILSPYLIFSSLIYRLILSSTSSLTLVSVPHFHNILLVSFCFLS